MSQTTSCCGLTRIGHQKVWPQSEVTTVTKLSPDKWTDGQEPPEPDSSRHIVNITEPTDGAEKKPWGEVKQAFIHDGKQPRLATTVTPNLFEDFAKSTSFHGFNKLVGHQSKIRKATWILILTVALCSFTAIVISRCVEYFQYQTTTSVTEIYTTPLDFPAVTICNYNMFMLPATKLKEAAITTSAPEEWIWSEPAFLAAAIVADEQVQQPGPNNEEVFFTKTVEIFLPKDLEMMYATTSDEILPMTAKDFFITKTEEFLPIKTKEIISTPTEETVSTTSDEIFATTVEELSSTMSGDDKTNIHSAKSNVARRSVDDSSVQEVNYLSQATLARLGWQLRDLEEVRELRKRNPDNSTMPDEEYTITLTECYFGQIKCSSSWFEPVYTTRGRCYTFNHMNINLTGATSDGLQQIRGGPDHGLKITLDIQKDRYNLRRAYSSMMGAKALVHPRHIHPDLDTGGVAVSPGRHADVAFTKTEHMTLPPKWGRCDPARRLRDLTRPYAIPTCIDECKSAFIFKQCGCQVFYYSSGADPVCNDTMFLRCAIPAEGDFDKQFSNICNCPVACHSEESVTQTSYSELFDGPEMHKILSRRLYPNITGPHEDNLNYFQENLVSFSVFYRSMMLKTVKQVKQLDEIGLISEIGGQMGMFIGVSALTIFEIVETIAMACITCRAKKPDN